MKDKKDKKNSEANIKEDAFTEFSSHLGNTKITQTKNCIYIQTDEISPFSANVE